MHIPDMQAPTSGKVGAAEISKGLITEIYRSDTISATEIAAVVIARRYRLKPMTARLVCHLAGIGGAA
jgi:hypothetical protein